MKKMKRVAFLFALCLGIMNLLPAVAKADTTYSSWSERGSKITLAWSRNDLWWTINSAYDIKSWDYDQDHFGLFVVNNGAKKMNFSNVDTYYIMFTNTFKAGVTIGGQTLGFDTDFDDTAEAWWNGNCYWEFQ